jgi:hypothetical protein
LSEFRTAFKKFRARLRQILDDEARAEDEDLMLAALYCRMCIEGLCYRRLELYKNKNPGSDFSGWQPAKF